MIIDLSHNKKKRDKDRSLWNLDADKNKKIKKEVLNKEEISR